MADEVQQHAIWQSEHLDLYNGSIFLDEAYADAARLLLVRYSRLGGSLKDGTWRHHRLGMLQRELTREIRIHVWHPRLVVPWEDKFRSVHDHRFDLVSTIVVGELEDVPHTVVWNRDTTTGWDHCSRVRVYEIVHAKEQVTKKGCSDAHLVEFLGEAFVYRHESRTFRAGDVYRIPRGLFHTTVPRGLAITLVHRSNFGDRLARILSSDETGQGSGIVPLDPELASQVLGEGEEALSKFADGSP